MPDTTRAACRAALLKACEVYQHRSGRMYVLMDDAAACMAEREAELEARLLESNELLRSCHAVALRDGVQTNWQALTRQLEAELQAQHVITNRIRAALTAAQGGTDG